MSAPKPSDNPVSAGDQQSGRVHRSFGNRPAPFPLHRGFIGAGAVLLMAALITDYTYYTTTLWQWANFSAWLITAGLMLMLLAVFPLLISFATGRAIRLNTTSFILVTAADLLSLVNAFVHTRDAWSSVVPQGILLSAVSTILLVIAGAQGWSLVCTRATGDRP
jgi:uncharacterized membrane protein